jgi:hypothetical protein
LLRDYALCFRNVRAEIASADVDIDPAVEPGVLALDDGWAVDDLQLLHGVAHALRVAQVDRVTLQAFHGLGDIHAAYGGPHDVLHIGDVEAEA